MEEVEPLLELGLHYEPFAHWGVPDYVPVEAVSEVSDLLKSDVLARMNKDIQGINRSRHYSILYQNDGRVWFK
ncbi:L-proline glycine betaine binding ABC transporter protein proX [Vibrio ishigakensis]|uniref:L-proline glycine betaine binding ABC transporter protein proX n=1 Tax=Vibrio ishigakensis TaxID=1481914 RepID=A0A0B8NIW0_9VIBR|nr:L-proline glycine betaine binding ABC transporter protein proX [Vibrio ishigakensis]